MPDMMCRQLGQTSPFPMDPTVMRDGAVRGDGMVTLLLHKVMAAREDCMQPRSGGILIKTCMPKPVGFVCLMRILLQR